MRWLISTLHMWRVGSLFTSCLHHDVNGLTPLDQLGKPILSLKFCILFCIVRLKSVRFNVLWFVFCCFVCFCFCFLFVCFTSFGTLTFIWSFLEFFFCFFYRWHRIEVTMTCSSGVSAPLRLARSGSFRLLSVMAKMPSRRNVRISNGSTVLVGVVCICTNGDEIMFQLCIT